MAASARDRLAELAKRRGYRLRWETSDLGVGVQMRSVEVLDGHRLVTSAFSMCGRGFDLERATNDCAVALVGGR